MKIGITCYPTYGGSGAVATELGIALAQRGHEIHFITYQQPFRLPSFLPRIYFHEVDVGRYPLFEYPPYDLALAVRMHEVVLKHELDLLHVHYAIPHATSAWIAREMLIPTRPDIKVLTTLHGTDITIVGQDPSFFPITKFSIEKSDGLTAVSQYLRTETLAAFGCTGCRIEVIPNFIDPAVYDRSRYAPQLAEQAKGRKVLMHVSNFRPVKRVRDVVRIYAKVATSIPSVLVMVGDGPERSAVYYHAEQLGVKAYVHFVGKQANIADYLGVADVFLLPSELESFGLAALEAQACEVPVIATRIGGIPEVVNDGESGFLSDVGDVAKMSVDTLRLLTNEEMRRAFGEKGREISVQRYSTGQIIPQYIAFYEKIVQKAKSATA